MSPSFKKLPFRSTIAFKIISILTIFFIAQGVTLVLWDQADIVNELQYGAQLSYKDVAQPVADELYDLIGDEQDIHSYFDSIAINFPGMELFYVTSEGRITYQASFVPSTLYKENVDITVLEKFLNSDETDYPITIDIPTATDLKYVFTTARIGDVKENYGYVLITLLEGGEDVNVSFWEEYGRIISRALMISILIASIVGFVFWYWIVRRINFIDQVVQKFRLGENQVKLDSHFQDELGHVANHFNEMITHINAMVEELKRKEKSRIELVARVSHELQTPLTVVHGNIETVLNHREKLSSENVDKKLETIYGQIKHLSEMVQDLSDIAIIESGQMPLNKEAFFMEELIESVISEYEGLAKAKNMKLVGEHEPQQTPVYADPLRIRQVLLNLVSNAIKYSSNDSNIILKVAYKDNQAFTSVKDFGIGIPEDEQKRIFKSYYRLDTHVRKGQKGTGLGLNICKYLIKMHDSVLSLESSPNEGTEFSFFLQCFDESLLKELPTK